MTINKALNSLYDFFSKFATAYVENSVPDKAVKPYLTFSLSISDWTENSIVFVNIYSHSTSFGEVSEIANKVIDAVGSGIRLPVSEKEFLYLSKGSPLVQNVDTGEEEEKHFYLVFQLQTFIY